MPDDVAVAGVLEAAVYNGAASAQWLHAASDRPCSHRGMEVISTPVCKKDAER